MSILSRCSDIIVANINVLIDKAENPEVMIGQLIREMEDGLAVARSHAASAIAAERRLSRELAEQSAGIEFWQAKARVAVAAHRDDLARAALARKIELQIAAAELATQHTGALATSMQVRTSLHAVEANLTVARRKQRSLIARHRAAQARQALCRAAGKRLGSGFTPSAQLQRWEQRLTDLEDVIAAQLEVQGLGGQETTIAAWETEAELDRELAALNEVVTSQLPTKPDSANRIACMDADHEHSSYAGNREEFATTRWSVVLRAAKQGDRQADDALALLCGQYWFPLYAYIRRRFADANEAQDLTQEFFARLLEKNVLDHAAPERGRFRSFLLTSLNNFLANEWDRAHAQKRGGSGRRLTLDLESGESRLSLEPSHDLTPERLFERQWALTLLDLVVTRLEAEFTAVGKARHFELLKEALAGGRERLAYAEIGAQLGLSEDAARQAAHRLRQRYRELLRAEVAQTVGDPDDVDDEVRRLFETFAR